MYVKLFLFLIYVVILKVSAGSSENNTKIKSDCGDFIACVDAWIGEFLVNDNKHVPARQVEESHVFNAMGDILSEISSFIADTFKNITKETTLIHNDFNKTVIGVQTFAINDTYINSNHSSDKVKVLLLDTVKESYKQLNHTKTLNIILNNKNEEKNKRDDGKMLAEKRKMLAETAYLVTTNVPFSYTTVNIFDVMQPKKFGETPNEETAVKERINNVPFSPNIHGEKEMNDIHLDTTNSNVNTTSNVVNKYNNTYVEIPQEVASKYKITYKTPIHAINLEIKEKDDTNIAQQKVTVNDTVKNIFDILNSFNSSVLDIVTQTLHKSNKSVILNQPTEDYVNSILDQNFTHFEIATKVENNLIESSTNRTRKDDVNDLKIHNVTSKTETNLGESETLNQTTKVDGTNLSSHNFTYTKQETDKGVNLTNPKIPHKSENDDDYNTKIQFYKEIVPDTNTETINNDVDIFEDQNPHENEISVYDNFNYNIHGENGTDYLELDYISIYKDVTVEDVEYTPPIYIPPTSSPVTSDEIYEDSGIEAIFPWIATVFVKNNSSDQFEYICDGGLVSERVVLTAARCLKKSNVTENVGNVLIILGKRSLLATGTNEKVLRVKQIKLHNNFTDVEGNVDNDLAIIVLDETVVFNDDIQPAVLANDKDDDYVDAKYAATTGWHITGSVTPIYFNEESRGACVKNTVSTNTFCARFGDGITTCPSFGGLFVSRGDTEWRLQGISTGKPTSAGVCFNKNVTFTNLKNYFRWIMENVNMNEGY